MSGSYEKYKSECGLYEYGVGLHAGLTVFAIERLIGRVSKALLYYFPHRRCALLDTQSSIHCTIFLFLLVI